MTPIRLHGSDVPTRILLDKLREDSLSSFITDVIDQDGEPRGEWRSLGMAQHTFIHLSSSLRLAFDMTGDLDELVYLQSIPEFVLAAIQARDYKLLGVIGRARLHIAEVEFTPSAFRGRVIFDVGEHRALEASNLRQEWQESPA